MQNAIDEPLHFAAVHFCPGMSIRQHGFTEQRDCRRLPAVHPWL